MSVQAQAERPPIGPSPYRTKIWLDRYPDGVGAALGSAIPGSLVQIFDETVRRFPERPALESFGVRRSYGELAKDAGAISSWLIANGTRKGDRVAIMMPNVMAYPAVMFGVLMAGATVVNVNPLYTPRELTTQLADSGATTIFVLENFAHTVERCEPAARPTRIVIVSPGDGLGPKGAVVNAVSRWVRRAVPAYSLPGAVRFADVIKVGRARPLAPVQTSRDDIAFLQYTGGTSGIPKGAMLSHGNVVANVLQCESWFEGGFRDVVPTMVTALPLYHIFALTACCMLMVRLGACQLLIANPRDIPAFVKTLQTRPFTCLSGVNTLYNALAAAPGIDKVDFRQMRICISGGMATQRAVAERWRQLTGRPIVEGYGLSETSPVVSANRFDIDAFTGTIGYPLPSTEISIRNPDGREVPHGEPGELCVRGPQVMRGYWQRPTETSDATTPDGFFRTGDAAVLELDGALRIVDRMKDMIIVSGFNVYPNEVEDVIASCPGVREVAVIGLPGAEQGESVAAFVVRDNPLLTEADVAATCRDALTAYKRPKTIVFRDSLPKTNVGKVLRRALKEEVLSAGIA